MKITVQPPAQKPVSPRFAELENGEVFVYNNHAHPQTPYMKGAADRAVCLSNGEICTPHWSVGYVTRLKPVGEHVFARVE